MSLVIQRTLQARGLQRIGRLPIAAGQTYKAGDYLAVNASGQLIQAATSGDGTATNGQIPIWSAGLVNLVVGRAVEDAQPSANDPTIIPTTKLYGEFIIAEPGTHFEIPIWHATYTSAYPNPNLLGTGFEIWNLSSAAAWATAAQVLAQGGPLQAVQVPSNAYVIRLDKTTAVKAQIVGFLPDDYAGWPDVGQATPPTTGVLPLYCRAWCEFLGGATYLSGARPIVRTN